MTDDLFSAAERNRLQRLDGRLRQIEYAFLDVVARAPALAREMAEIRKELRAVLEPPSEEVPSEAADSVPVDSSAEVGYTPSGTRTTEP